MRRHIVLALLLGCAEVTEEKLDPPTTPASTVLTKETPSGVVTGSVDAEASTTQRIAASQKAEIKGVYVEFPVGSITSDTEIALQDGDSALGGVGALPEELGVAATTSIAAAGPPLSISSSGDVEPVAPFTLMIPLPVETGASLSDPALVSTSEGKLALLYLLKSAAGNALGLQVITREHLVGAMLRVEPRRLGWFRIVLLSAGTASVPEKATAREPASKS